MSSILLPISISEKTTINNLDNNSLEIPTASAGAVPIIYREYIYVYGWTMIYNFTIIADDGLGTDLCNISMGIEDSTDFSSLSPNVNGSYTLKGIHIYNASQEYTIEINVTDGDSDMVTYTEVIEPYNLVTELIWNVDIGDYLVYNITNNTENWYGRYEIINYSTTNALGTDFVAVNASHSRWMGDSEWILVSDYLGGHTSIERDISVALEGLMLVSQGTLLIPMGFIGYDFAMFWLMFAIANDMSCEVNLNTTYSINLTISSTTNLVVEWNEEGIVTYYLWDDPSTHVELIYVDAPSILPSDNIEYEFGTEDNYIGWTVEPEHVFGENATYEVLMDGESYIELSNLTEDGVVSIDADGLEIGYYNYTIIVYDGSGRVINDTIYVHVFETTIPPPPPEEEGLGILEISLIVVGSIGGAGVIIYLILRKKKEVNIKGTQAFDPNICKLHPELPECKKLLNK